MAKNGGASTAKDDAAGKTSETAAPIAPTPEGELAPNVREVIDILEGADRNGLERDVPEGARWIVLSDTVAKRLVRLLKQQ